MATFPSKVNYATGDILTATNMNEIGQAINLLDGAQFSAGKNKIINGDFGIWQRGTTFTSPNSGTYVADRFQYTYDGNGTATISRQNFTAGTAPVAGYESQYFFRHLVTAAGTTTFCNIFQPIEDVRTFAGQTVTFSFWAKADTARSSFIYAEQNFGSGGSSVVQYLSMGSASLTTSWQRFTFTVALSSIAGKTIGTNSTLNFYIRGGITLNATTDIWGVQLEAASTASNFQTATGTKQGELAACQRYYYRNNALGTVAFAVFGQGSALSTTDAKIYVVFPTAMRVTPTAIDFPTLATSFVLIDANAGGPALSALTLSSAETTTTTGTLNATGALATLTQFRPYVIRANNTTSAYIGWSAEL